MPEREGSLKDRWQEGAKVSKMENAEEVSIVNAEGLRELGFSDYEIEGARLVEMRRRQMLINPRSAEDFSALKEWNRLGRGNREMRRFQRWFEEAAAAGDFIGEARARTNAYLQKKLPVKEMEGISGELLFDVGHQVLGVEKGGICSLSGKSYYFVGRDAESGRLILSEARGLLQNCKFLTVEAAARLVELGQLTV